MNKLSPMMEHYMVLKEKYSDCILLYRLGDFYEMFFKDAEIASKVLELTLTGRDCGLEKRAPMCGVPYHAVDTYISRLLGAGYKVAICEQLSNPKEQKGMVKRDVIRVITPGTNTNEEMLDSSTNHFLAGVSVYNGDYAVALLDITTGEFNVKTIKNGDLEEVEDYLLGNSPSEIISDSGICEKSRSLPSVIGERLVKFTNYYDYAFDYDNAAQSLQKHFGVFDVSALGLEAHKAAVCAAGGVIDYVLNTQKRNLSHISRINVVEKTDFMYIDFNTIRNLDLVESQIDGKKYGSLLWVLDKTKTSMGARLIRNWILHPLKSLQQIEARQAAIGELYKNLTVRAALGNMLSQIKDLQRLVTKIAYGNIMPRDCLLLSDSLKYMPSIIKALNRLKSPLIANLADNMSELSEVVDKIDMAIERNETPAVLKDGNYIKTGYSEELDNLRELRNGGSDRISKFEEKQREITGVQALKVRYNRIFGYYIEIPNNKKPETLPPDYIRKQTIANGERYVNEELMKLERDILGATERIIVLEERLYSGVKDFLSDHASDIQKNAQIIAVLDCLLSLSQVAVENNYVKPKFVKEEGVIRITDGKHPVVEKLLKANEFVPNDVVLDKETSTMIITGPNMAGKSTYIRQVALLVLMAHIGSFVPATKMELGIVDRIFTRIGASDNLTRGQSTFMVEMLEVANILNNATSKSLIILDEVGRGTSTLDGLSIAWAIVEHISLKIKANVLFATHYHELCELESLLPGIKNFKILINESPNGIVFLYKIARGGANKSFGIEVAEIAGISKEVIARARNILSKVTENHELTGGLKDKLSGGASSGGFSIGGDQLSLFPEDETFTEIKNILRSTDTNRCTPIEALTILNDLKKLAEKK